ncbi:hypothetical protein A3Q56_02177 [Intoshia linei]|uniref:ubiquitinyl hydrolase 1 n=1 Tax=Intoshia linei TaxID=1819745 RepID=A0A177B701_9BILA|nr:hypothetical protein A3Q56_02177 [Intoshia linei]
MTKTNTLLNYAGLQNFGNTCYLNSVIQAMYFCESFRNQVLSYKCDKENLLTTLSELYKQMNGNIPGKQNGIVHPKRFYNCLCMHNEIFNNDNEHDAHEFFNYILNNIADLVQNDLKHTSCNVNWVYDLFQGVMTNETTCLCCENISTKDEFFIDLSLEVESNISIYFALKNFSKKELMCADSKYFCNVCKCKQEAKRRIRIKKPPKLLALHLKRFKYQDSLRRFTKLNYKVSFSQELRFPNLIGEKYNKLYKLIACVAHCGLTISSGHYLTFVRQGNGWLLFDDNAVENLPYWNIESFFGGSTNMPTRSETGYILFYQQTI